jgi:hypothetical protein
MSIATYALIIALASLIWNIAATAYSWKFTRPAIRIAAVPSWTRKGSWLKIDVQNRGGSSIEVKEIIVYWWFKKGWPRKRVPWRIISGAGIRQPSARGVTNTSAGPDFPHTIQPYHAQTWTFDRTELLKSWANSAEHSEKLLIEVRLATGKSVRKKINAESVGDELMLAQPGEQNESAQDKDSQES